MIYNFSIFSITSLSLSLSLNLLNIIKFDFFDKFTCYLRITPLHWNLLKYFKVNFYLIKMISTWRIHGFKNRNGQRTKNGSDFWFLQVELTIFSIFFGPILWCPILCPIPNWTDSTGQSSLVFKTIEWLLYNYFMLIYVVLFSTNLIISWKFIWNSVLIFYRYF